MQKTISQRLEKMRDHLQLLDFDVRGVGRCRVGNGLQIDRHKGKQVKRNCRDVIPVPRFLRFLP